MDRTTALNRAGVVVVRFFDMPDWLQQQVAWLHQFRDQYMTEEVTYIQDGVSATMPMTVLREQNEHLTDVGVMIVNTRRQDFMADPDDFVAAGFEMPARGDKIVRVVKDKEIEYEVCSDGEEPPYRESTRYRLAIRIHTNRTAIDEVPQP